MGSRQRFSVLLCQLDLNVILLKEDETSDWQSCAGTNHYSDFGEVREGYSGCCVMVGVWRGEGGGNVGRRGFGVTRGITWGVKGASFGVEHIAISIVVVGAWDSRCWDRLSNGEWDSEITLTLERSFNGAGTLIVDICVLGVYQAVGAAWEVVIGAGEEICMDVRVRPEAMSTLWRRVADAPLFLMVLRVILGICIACKPKGRLSSDWVEVFE
ncbi:hypothetical protein Tco_0815476 [Tanacetum coccineum]